MFNGSIKNLTAEWDITTLTKFSFKNFNQALIVLLVAFLVLTDQITVNRDVRFYSFSNLILLFAVRNEEFDCLVFDSDFGKKCGLDSAGKGGFAYELRSIYVQNLLPEVLITIEKTRKRGPKWWVITQNDES